MIKILLVDPEKNFEHSICHSLAFQSDFELAGSGKDGYDAFILAKKIKPDIILLNLPLLEELQVIPLLKNNVPSAGIIIITYTNPIEENMYRYYFKHISGCLTHKASSDLLCQAVRTVHCGGHLFVSDQLIERFFFPQKNATPIPHNITVTELKIMGFIKEGLANREIAERLCLTEGTIRNKISSILQKTGLHDRTQIAIFSIKAGL